MLLRASVPAAIFVIACSSTPTPPADTPATDSPRAQKGAPRGEPEGLDSEQIIEVVKQREMAFRGCHTLEYGGGPLESGHVVIEWEVKANGRVGKAFVSESSFDNAQLDDCLVGVMKDLEFPTAPGSTEVSYRFRFRGRSKD